MVVIVEYMCLMGLTLGLSIHTPTPPHSLNFRRSGVEDWTRKKAPHGPHTHMLRQHPPAVATLATADVEAGPELGEGRGGETLGEDVCKLGGGRDV